MAAACVPCGSVMPAKLDIAAWCGMLPCEGASCCIRLELAATSPSCQTDQIVHGGPYWTALVGDAQLLCLVLQFPQVHAPVLQILVLLQAHDHAHASLHCQSLAQQCLPGPGTRRPEQEVHLARTGVHAAASAALGAGTELCTQYLYSQNLQPVTLSHAQWPSSMISP